MSEIVTGLESIANKYDALILDLWGVIHDGTHLYPGVAETLNKLRAAGKKICLLSNAPRRARKVEAVLIELGIKPSQYDFIHSSGESGYQWLASKENKVGNRYYYIGPDKDLDVTQGLEFMRVDDISKASFLLNVGFGTESQTTHDFTDLLTKAAKRLPMVCLNPDLEVVKQTGERFPCAGVLAREYQKLGGKVIWFGKPYPTIYRESLQKLAMDKSRVLAIGDSIDTDILGAFQAGIDSVLVTGGILKESTPAQINEMCETRKCTPTYSMPGLSW